MKPTEITNVLDITLKANKENRNMVPLFTGDAGIGKSQICQAWAKKQGNDFGFIDLRIAYLEAPDFVGVTFIVNGRQKFATPDFLPTVGSKDTPEKGLILLEEPNRGNISVRNCLMQLLTDRKVGDAKLKDGWVIAGCINPDEEGYEVEAMDTALKDRFIELPVEYSKEEFVKYMEKSEWDERIIQFVKSDFWLYKRPKELGNKGKYIAPRTWHPLNVVLKTMPNLTSDLLYIFASGALGQNVGLEFHNFCFNNTPVLVKDLLKNKKASLKKLKDYSEGKNISSSMVAVTIDDFIKNFDETNAVDYDLLSEVMDNINVDQGFSLLQECVEKRIKNTSKSSLSQDETTSLVREELSKFNKKYSKTIERMKERKNNA